MAATGPADGGRGPLLSVVVPVHDVAEYVAACLESIQAQPVDDLEVLVVDDGSRDRSADIVASYAAADPRITLLRQPNSGVSIARNNGIGRCTGEYLTFVDPDDVLPTDAWSTMLATLQRTGSDFVVGSAERLEERPGEVHRYVTPLMRRNHGRDRFGIHITDQPLLLADIFVWNKIFRRDFWTTAGITFPERTRYQDQPALTEAFLAADAIDVLTEVVYEWRHRPTLNSATQKRAELANLTERVNTKRQTVHAVRDHVEAGGDPELLRVLLTEILPIDMWEHFRAAAAATPGEGDADAYWELLRDCVREFWYDAGVPFEETTLPPRQRLMGWLTAQDRREDLVRLIEFLDDHPGPLPVVDGRLDHPWSEEPGIPARLVTP